MFTTPNEVRVHYPTTPEGGRDAASPDHIVVNVSRRTTIEQHHHQELALLGDGPWHLKDIPEQVAST